MFNRHSYDSSIHSPVLTDNLNIIKRGFQIKGGGGSEKCSRSKVATQLLIVEKHQYNFSCSLHLYIKQNETFLIANLSNVNTKSCLRNQTPLCIHLLVVLVPSHRHVVFWGSLFPLITDNWLKLFKLNCLQFRWKNNPF